MTVALIIILSGCSFKLKTQEIESDEYKSIGNEMELFGFGIGESIHNIKGILGEPEKEKTGYLKYDKNKVKVFYDFNTSKFISTSNEGFKVLEDISVGVSRKELIEQYSDLDMFEKIEEETPERDSFIFFLTEDQKVVLYLVEDHVSEIILSSKDVPYDKLFAKKMDKEEVLSDEEIIISAHFLTFKTDFYANNLKVQSDDFIGYAKLGLVEDVPLPLGMSKSELTRRFGIPNYVISGEGAVEIYYYYNRFNLYLGFNGDDKLVELKLPVNLPYDHSLNKKRLEEIRSNTENLREYGVYFTKTNNTVSEVVIYLKNKF